VSFSYFPQNKPKYLFDLGIPVNEEYNSEIADEALSIANQYIQDKIHMNDESN